MHVSSQAARTMRKIDVFLHGCLSEVATQLHRQPACTTCPLVPATTCMHTSLKTSRSTTCCVHLVFACALQEMEEEANVKRARKAAEAAFLQLLKDNTPPDAASTSPRELPRCLPACLPAHLPACPPACMRACRPGRRTQQQPACSQTYGECMWTSPAVVLCCARPSQSCEWQCPCVSAQGGH
jgi:hypothetical protein